MTLKKSYTQVKKQTTLMMMVALKSKTYLLSVDYYSKYIEVTELSNLSAGNTIEALKGHFERHGIPEELTTDCCTQYTSAEFKNLKKKKLQKPTTSNMC